MAASNQVGSLPYAIPGVVPTGIPERGYDGPEAEKLRQDRVVGQFRERDPELFKAVAEKRAKVRRELAEWEVMRTKLVGAVGHDGAHDVLTAIDRDMTEAERRAATQGTADLNKEYRAPEFAFSDEEQRARRLKK